MGLKFGSGSKKKMNDTNDGKKNLKIFWNGYQNLLDKSKSGKKINYLMAKALCKRQSSR